MSNILANFHQDKDLWLKERAKGITASDASAVLGLSTFKTPFKVWAEKTQVLDNDFVESERMKWGSRLETGIALGFAQEQGIEVSQCGDLVAHEKYNWLMATPDFYGSDGSVVEIKNSSKYQDWMDGNMPDHAHVQVIIQLACTGLEFGHLAALIQGSKLEHRIIFKDASLEETIIAKLEEFKGLIDNRTAPPLLSEDLATVGALYKQGADIDLTLNDSWIPTIERYLELKGQISTLEDEKAQAEAMIKAHLKEASRAVCGPYSLSWKTSERKGYVVKPSTIRTFSIKDLKTK